MIDSKNKTTLLLVILVLSCGYIDGKKSELSKEKYSVCTKDMDCGLGRYCSDDKICTIDCRTDKDCGLIYESGGVYSCSPCGRCLKKGEKDRRCILVKDIACEQDGDCTKNLTNDYICASNGFCVKKCNRDLDCRKLGRGWSCGNKNVCIRRCFCHKDCYFFGWGYECKLPLGINEDENCKSENPVMGECIPREGGVDWGNNVDFEKDSYAYTGIWGWNLNYAVRTTGLPLVSQQDSVSITYGLAKIIQNSKGGISIYLKLCSIRLQNFKEDDSDFEDLAYIVVPDSYSDAIPILVNNTEALPEMRTNVSFDTDIVLDVRGARLPDPWNTPLPSYEDLRYVYDQDRDSKPGMTVFVSGTLSGEVYNVQRWWVKYHIKVVDKNRMSGLVDFNSEESIVGASNKMFLAKIKVVPHPQPDRSYFRAIRVSNDSDCNTVIEMSKDKNSYIYFTPHYSN
ncbi:MAG: hypothetical protein N2746_01400 [Deltaproteobacteria bacterium]|nr:hypothetical protein [Deltaproteobacteria bacterium]